MMMLQKLSNWHAWRRQEGTSGSTRVSPCIQNPAHHRVKVLTLSNLIEALALAPVSLGVRFKGRINGQRECRLESGSESFGDSCGTPELA